MIVKIYWNIPIHEPRKNRGQKFGGWKFWTNDFTFFLLSDTFPHNLFARTFIFMAMPFSILASLLASVSLCYSFVSHVRPFKRAPFLNISTFTQFRLLCRGKRRENIFPFLPSAGARIYIIIACIICFPFIFHTFLRRNFHSHELHRSTIAHSLNSFIRSFKSAEKNLVWL